MNAAEAREKSLEVAEAKTASILKLCSVKHNEIIYAVAKAAANGERKLIINLSRVHYSTLVQLVAEGYFLADEGQEGYCILSW